MRNNFINQNTELTYVCLFVCFTESLTKPDSTHFLRYLDLYPFLSHSFHRGYFMHFKYSQKVLSHPSCHHEYANIINVLLTFKKFAYSLHKLTHISLVFYSSMDFNKYIISCVHITVSQRVISPLQNSSLLKLFILPFFPREPMVNAELFNVAVLPFPKFHITGTCSMWPFKPIYFTQCLCRLLLHFHGVFHSSMLVSFIHLIIFHCKVVP